MSEIVYVIPIFLPDEGEINIAKSEQLALPDYLPDVTADRQRWLETESVKYDRFKTLSRVLTMFRGECQCRCIDDEDIGSEAALLAWVWATMSSVYPVGVPGGWGISDWWGTLVNRSIRNNVTVPQWGRPSAMHRFQKYTLYDFCNLYRAGSNPYLKPLPPISYVLQMWLGRTYTSIEAIELMAEVDSQDPKIQECLCELAYGLAETQARVTGA